MKKITLSFLSLLFSACLFAQNTREWGTYYGGTGSDFGYAVATDNSGNVYVAGNTNDNDASVFFASTGFQNTYGGGTNDAFLVKFDSNGNRLWSTYYGGSGNDQGYAVTTDANGDVYLGGFTTSINGISTLISHQPAFGGGTYDAFIVKFDGTGNRLWGTYYGGTNSSYGQALVTDPLGNLYFGGYTSDTQVGSIATPGAHQIINGGGNYDAYLVMFDSGGNRIWGTYYGGAGSEGVFPPAAVPSTNVSVALDKAGAVYLGGYTSSAAGIATLGAFQTFNAGGAFDGFAAKFTPIGTRIWGTYFGDANQDEIRSIAVHGDNLYLSGRTASNNNIATVGSYQDFYGGGSYDAFLARFDTSGAQIWSTYYGDAVQEWGLSVTTDFEGNIYQAGRTSSAAFIASPDGFQTTFGGAVDAYVVKFDTSGFMYCATYLGGTASDLGYGVAISNGKIYMAGHTGSAAGIAGSGYDNTYGGGAGTNDAFLAKFTSCIYTTMSQTDPLCGGVCDGTATADPSYGATLLPYSYVWSPGGQTTQTATGLCAGSYTVIVSDANGNTTTDFVTITEPTAITTTITTTNTNCGLNNGDATASVSGGNPTYIYSWTTSPVQTTATATGLGAGTYTVLITDTDGCTDTATATIFTIGGPTVTITAQTNVSCFGGNNGSATSSATGGNLPYTYGWTTSPFQFTPTATGLIAGTYTAVVSDALSCTGIAIVTITQPAVLTITVTTNNGTCAGNDASATANLSGGTTPYTYSWTTSPVQTTATATGLSTGTYTVSITDANGCTQTSPATINSPSGPTASIASQTNVSCNGGNDGSATAGISGGTAPFTFSWSTSPAQTTITATGLSVGNYTVTVTDANVCTSTAMVTITQPAAMTSTVTTTNATCGNSDGSATASAGNGSPPYTYSWTTSPVQITSTATGLAAGIYTVTITDANGCTVSATATVVNTNGPTTTSSVLTNATCNGGNNGTATTNPSGGTPPYTYSWTTSPVQTTQTATGLTAGNYSVTVTDAGGCSVISTVTITEPVAITLSVTTTGATCGNNDGTATVSASNGNPPYTYSWTTSPVQITATATGLAGGNYTVTITDANGCTQTATAVISVSSGVSASILSQTNTSCNGGSDGSATASASGGTSPYTYSWSTAPTQTTITATGLMSGSYTVTITDANGCTGTSAVTITEPTAITINISTIPATCGNNDGSATASVSGGAPSYNYNWSSGQTTATANNLTAGSYTITITDASGCTQTSAVIIINSNGPTGSIIAQTNVSCFGGSDGSATADATGSTPPYTYIWNTSPAQTGATATGLSSGMYNVTIADAGGCIGIAIVAITEPSAVTASATPLSNASCSTCCDGTASSSASGGTTPYIYGWSTSPVQNTVTATGLCASSIYTVCITDANGCSSCDTVLIPFSSPTGIQLSVIGNQLSVYPNPANDYLFIDGITSSSEKLEVNVVNIFGQTMMRNYFDVNGKFSEKINTENLPAGIYFIEIKSNDMTKKLKFVIQ